MPRRASNQHLLLYDGVCGLCSRMVHFVLVRDPHAVFSFAPLQSPLGQATIRSVGDDPANAPTFFVRADYQTPQGRVIGRAAAVFFVLDALGWPWRAAGVMRILPVSWLNGLYGVFARNRYRLFGRAEQCFVPPHEYRGRFIDG